MAGFSFDTGAIINISYECSTSTLKFEKLNVINIFNYLRRKKVLL